MSARGTIRDSGLIDTLEALNSAPFKGSVWRVVREGRDPCQCSASGGRWDDSTFDVLYTSKARDGAIAEMHFHLSRGQPIFPTKVRYHVHELNVTLEHALHIPNLRSLASLGLDTSRYGQLSYHEREQEYLRTHEIAEVAHFLDFDGIVVPNARWDCSNIVIFCDRVPPTGIELLHDHGIINWNVWMNSKRIK
jgi:RES domain-containing protein